MRTFSFTLPDDEAMVLDETIKTLRYAYPDLNDNDAMVALTRMGWEEILRRLDISDRKAAP